jgi:hypothetical protein
MTRLLADSSHVPQKTGVRNSKVPANVHARAKVANHHGTQADLRPVTNGDVIRYYSPRTDPALTANVSIAVHNCAMADEGFLADYYVVGEKRIVADSAPGTDPCGLPE